MQSIGIATANPHDSDPRAAGASVSVVIPALNEAGSVGDVVARVRRAWPWHEVIVVDDGSLDATAQEASASGARVVRHPYSKGNGAAIKTGVRQSTGTFVLILDADGQHAPEDATRLIERLGDFDLVVGARSNSSHRSIARRLGNGVLNALASYLTGRTIPDLTSGFRVARRSCMQELLHLLPNGFSTPTTTTLAFIKLGYDVAFVPIEAQRGTGASRIRLLRDGMRFGLILLKLVTLFSPLRIFVPISAGALCVGGAYAAASVLTGGRIPNGAMLLILFAAMVFLVGLVAEQIASLRFEGTLRS